MTRLGSPEQLAAVRQELAAAAEGKKRVLVCSTGCLAIGAREIEAAFREGVAEAGLEDEVEVVATGCHGLCAMAPVVVIEPDDVIYGRVRAKFVPDVIAKTVQQGEIVSRLTYGRDEATAHPADIPFFEHQTKRVLHNVGRIDPQRIEDAIGRGVYEAAAKALCELQPDEVIAEVRTSAVRGRGGGGFPVWRKWESCRAYAAEDRYLICNADEGDPGAFMDRALLEGDPHSVIEGMIIAAYAVGSSRGYVYVRAEYPIAVRHVRLAIEQAREWGLLGDDILGSGFSFDVEVREGAGAFVCGEASALVASIEGRRGQPRPKPPRMAEKGLFGLPTNINNVETFANIPMIVAEGGAAYAESGTEGSKGTKIFALAGQVRNTGLVEVPMGATIREIVFGVGGGIPRGREFKAVQMGGPSGGCVPAAHLDLPIDYDSLREVGAIMGSGGMIVMDDTTCIVDIARYFISFCANESCGACAPCRLGNVRLEEVLDRICQGEGTEADLDALERLADVVRSTIAVRPGSDRAQSGALDAGALPRRVPRPRHRQDLPGRGVQGAGTAGAGAGRKRGIGGDRRQCRARRPSPSTAGRSRWTGVPRCWRLPSRSASTSPASATTHGCRRSPPAGSASSRSRACTSLTTACSTKVAEGMVVRTETDVIASMRKSVLELILGDHRVSCPTCDKNGDCALHALRLPLRGRPVRLRRIRAATGRAQLQHRQRGHRLRPAAVYHLRPLRAHL